MTEAVSDAEAPKEDKGADRETRFKPCTKKTWCIREEGHADACQEINRPAKP